MKKLIIVILTFFILTINVNALDLSSKNIVLYNLNEDKVVYEKNKDKKTSIASLTKIMTTIVAIENIDNYNKTVVLNSDMFKGIREENAYVIGLKNNQKVTYNDLLYGMFLSSGADATRGIVLSIAKTEDEYVKLMNKKAKEIGMNNTNFKNTIGLDINNQYSTVNDVAILLKYALNNKKFYEIFTTKKYTFTDKSLTVYSSYQKTADKYKYNVNYILGGKTGYTLNAGRALASIAIDKKNNIEYMLITTNASTDTKEAYHVLDATKVYYYYFSNYKYHNLVNKSDLLLTLKTKYSKEKEIKIYATEDIKYYLKNDFKKQNVKLKYKGITEINPNIKKNTKLGKIEVNYNNELLNSFDIYLSHQIKFSITEYLKYNIQYVIGIIFILLLFLIIVIKRRRK